MIELIGMSNTWNNDPSRRIVELQSDTAPAQLPMNGNGIPGMSESILIAPGSTFIVLNPFKVNRMGTSGWYEI